VIRDLKHLFTVLRGRVPVQRPLFCDTCPDVVRDLSKRQYEAYKESGFKYASHGCPRGGMLRDPLAEGVPV
jgi:hypothetical protein